MVEISHRNDGAARKWPTFLYIAALIVLSRQSKNRRFSEVLRLRILIKEEPVNATIYANPLGILIAPI
jgi:hypothetical protein